MPRYLVARNASGETLERGDVVTVSDSVVQAATTVPSTVQVATQVPARLLVYAPGGGRVPTCIRALSGSLGAVPLAVVMGAFDGGTDAEDGTLTVLQQEGFVDHELAGSPSVNDPVYVSDTGTLSLTPGTGGEPIGHVHEAEAGMWRPWLDVTNGIGNSLFLQRGSGAVPRTMQEKARERLAINDFLPTGAPDDWRTALVDALDEASTTTGAYVWLPRQSTAREIDNTGLGPIDITGRDSVTVLGEGKNTSRFDVTTTDGTALFYSAPPSGVSLQDWLWDAVYFDLKVGSGWFLDFAAKGLSKSFFGERFRVWQRDPNHGIIRGNVQGSGGFLEGFWRGEWEHGTSQRPATVPAIEIYDKGSLFGPIDFRPHRIHCHDSRAYFFWVNNSSGGNWAHCIEFHPQNIESPRGGLVHFAGVKAARIGGPLSIFDTEEIDRDLFEMIDGQADEDGPGGQVNQAVVFDQHVAHAGDLVAVAGEFLNVDSITRSSTTATATTEDPHDYVSGDVVEVFNCDGHDHGNANGYNLDGASITVTGTDTFTYTVNGSLTTPAVAVSGQIKVRRLRRAADTISQVGGVATLDTVQDHGLEVGQVVYNADWNQSGYNGRFVVLTAPTSKRVTFAVDGGTATPGTGAGTWGRGAVDVALLGGDNGCSFIGCNGTNARDLEVDEGENPVFWAPLTGNRVIRYRKHSNSTACGIGSSVPGLETGSVETGSVKTASITELETGDGVHLASSVIIGAAQDINHAITDVQVYNVAVSWSAAVVAGTTAEKDLTVTGVAVNDRVQAAIVSTGSNPLGTGIYPVGFPMVVADDKIRIVVWNTTGSDATPTTRTWRFTVTRH